MGCHLERRGERLLAEAAVGPTTLNLEYQRPTQEGSHQNQSGEKAEAGVGKLDGDGFDDVGSNQNFETQQQRLAYPYLILIIMALYISSTREKKRRPHDPGDYNKHAKDYDANTNQMDHVAYGRFEGIFHRLHPASVASGFL
jgi:hypothetical protein